VSIRTKLIILLLAFTGIPLLLFGTFMFTKSRSELETVRIAQLNNIADLKKDKIETFFIERKGDLSTAQRIESIRRNLPALNRTITHSQSPAYLQAKKELDDRLKPYQDAYGYIDIMLADAQGRIVYTRNDAHGATKLGKVVEDRRSFAEGKKDIYFSDVYFDKSVDQHFEMLGVAPIKDSEGNFVGEIIFEMDMRPIYKFIQETTGLGVTGEALIVRSEGNEVLFLSPLRHFPDAALQKRAPLNNKAALAAQMAALGETGSGITSDYHGTEVLAAWRYIPSLRWGLVTKIDSDEAFAPVRQLKAVTVVAALFMAVIGVCAAILVARTVTRPVHELQKGAEAIAAGDLRQRVGSGAHDEIGRLSRAIDTMTRALIHDIAERERAEEAVKSLNENLQHHVRQLEETNKELEAFSYSVSHDLRSPLRSIDGFSLALLEDYSDKLDDEGKNYLARVRGATQRMGQLIDDLLKLSRLARMEMKRDRVDLSAMASGIASRLRDHHPERPAEFIIAGGLTAFGDERLLTAALENLFGNAWKFSEKTPRTVIEFGVTDAGGDPAFFVKDNGAGFDMAYADKLFNPFQRLHHAAEFSGTGIGLATVKRIINRHGGRVWIEGAVGKGTTVYFTL
jgi:signal transduction histidine kinase